MADRIAGTNAIIYADLPMVETTPTVAVTDPLGDPVVVPFVSGYGEARWSFTIPGASLTRHGTYTALWSYLGGSVTRRFTVNAETAGMSLFDLRTMIASREAPVMRGTIGSYLAGTIVDPDLLGGAGNYRGKWVILHPDNGTSLAGRIRRVQDFTGSAMVLTSPFWGDPRPSARYVMLPSNLHPREIDDALLLAVTEMAGASRVPLQVTLPLVAGQRTNTVQAVLPAEFTRIDTIWTASAAQHPETKVGAEINRQAWTVEPNRTLTIAFPFGNELDPGDAVTVHGTRQFTVPQFEDSLLDVEPSAVVTRVALELLAARAASGAIDVSDHIRRQMMLGNEFEVHVRRMAGRIPNGSRRLVR